MVSLTIYSMDSHTKGATSMDSLKRNDVDLALQKEVIPHLFSPYSVDCIASYMTRSRNTPIELMKLRIRDIFHAIVKPLSYSLLRTSEVEEVLYRMRLFAKQTKMT